MSRLRRIEQRRRSLEEIRDIMSAIKALAYIETRKLGHIVDAQRAITEQISRAAGDLLEFNPMVPSTEPLPTLVLIAIGTQRGFCGEINRRIRAAIDRRRGDSGGRAVHLIAIGRKLQSALEAEGVSAQVTFVEGANVAQEVPIVLSAVIDELDSLREALGLLDVCGLHCKDRNEVTETGILPPFRRLAGAKPQHAHPPILNRPPTDVLLDLADQYLIACLHEILFASLLHENQSRVTHIGDAVTHLDGKLAGLAHQSNALRQEEITEEIEVILLNVIDASGPHPRVAAIPQAGRPRSPGSSADTRHIE